MPGRIPRFVVVALAFLVGALSTAAGADDDWKIVDQTAATPRSVSDQAGVSALQSNGGQRRSFKACGEIALAPKEPFTSIVARLNAVWGTHFPVYESVAITTPHANPKGCIFYNRLYIDRMMVRTMDVTEEEQYLVMVNTLMARELGHLLHGDGTPAREATPREKWELEADRFAGYTLYRLDLKHFDPTEIGFYLRGVGDGFVGVDTGPHGTGKQRVAAFQQGWELARLGKSEDSPPPAISGLE